MNAALLTIVVAARMAILPNHLLLRTGRQRCACTTIIVARRRTTR